MRKKSEDYKLSAVKYYLNNKVSLDNVCKILYLSLKTFVDNKKDYFNSLKDFTPLSLASFACWKACKLELDQVYKIYNKSSSKTGCYYKKYLKYLIKYLELKIVLFKCTF